MLMGDLEGWRQSTSGSNTEELTMSTAQVEIWKGDFGDAYVNEIAQTMIDCVD